MGVTCHKCAAPFGGGAQKYTKCQTCGIYYHVTDCGARYAGRPEIDTPLEACPKCNGVCMCSGGPVMCHVARLRIRREKAKAMSLDPRGLGVPGGAPHAGASLGAVGAEPGLGAFGDIGGAAGRGFPGTAGGGASFEHAYARGARQSGLAAFAGLGDLGGLGGLGSFNPDAANALRRLALMHAPRSGVSFPVGIIDELVTLNEQLRRENEKWQNVIALLARQLEREEKCAACQASRSATAADARSAANPAANGRGASLTDTEERAAAGTRVASLLGGLRDASAGPPNPLDAALHELGRAGAGAGMAEVPAEFPAVAGGEAGGGVQSPDV